MSCAEIRRLLAVLEAPPEERARCLAWSRWRQRHQACAQRCHEARRLRRHGACPETLPPVRHRTVLPTPTEAQWTEILAVLAAAERRPHPRRLPHRPVLEGLFWMMERSARWEDIPERFGSYHSIQTCYRRWRLAGIWAAILTILVSPAPLPAPLRDLAL